MLYRALQHRSLFIYAGILLAITCTLVGCTRPVVSPPAPSTPPAPAPVFTGHVTIFQVANADQAPHADANGLIAVPIEVNPASKDPARAAIDALIDCSGSPIPHGTRLLSINIDQSTGLATLDFSKEFKENFKGGDTAEAQVLNSVLATMGQFPSVQNVQFLVESKKIGSLGGTQDLQDPLPIIKNMDSSSTGT